MIDNFDKWSKNLQESQNLYESVEQHLANSVMYKFKFRKLKFDHVANEAIFAKSIENFFHILLKTPEMQRFKNLLKKNNKLRQEIADIVYTYAHRSKSELNSMGKIKPEELDIIEYLKTSFQEIFQKLQSHSKSK
jgi:hypothetical protein